MAFTEASKTLLCVYCANFVTIVVKKNDSVDSVPLLYGTPGLQYRKRCIRDLLLRYKNILNSTFAHQHISTLTTSPHLFSRES